MKEGDLITTYYAGFFRLKKIERRFWTKQEVEHYKSKNIEEGQEYSPLFYFEQEYDANGNPKKSKIKKCDADFCKLASESIIEELQKLEQRKENLLKIYGR